MRGWWDIPGRCAASRCTGLEHRHLAEHVRAVPAPVPAPAVERVHLDGPDVEPGRGAQAVVQVKRQHGGRHAVAAARGPLERLVEGAQAAHRGTPRRPARTAPRSSPPSGPCSCRAPSGVARPGSRSAGEADAPSATALHLRGHHVQLALDERFQGGRGRRGVPGSVVKGAQDRRC